MVMDARGVVSQAQISIAGVTGIMGDAKTGIYCRRVGLLRI